MKYISQKSSESDCEKLLRLALDVCEAMLISGAEINRVENTLERICLSYGARYVEVFAIPSAIICSVRMKNGDYSLQMRRIRHLKNDLFRLEALNALSREICAFAPPLEIFEEKLLLAMKSGSYPALAVFLAAAIACGSFSLVFGGKLRDAIISSIIGVIVFFIDKKSHISINPIIKTALSAFTGGALCQLFSLFVPNLNSGSVVIGSAVMLVPGLAFGGALRNMIYGDLLSGTIGAVRAALTALMIALGYIFAFSLFGGSYTETVREGGIIFRAVTTLIGVAAFAIIFDVKPSHLPSIAIGGLITFAVYKLSALVPFTDFVSAFIASSVSSALSEILARIEKAPALVFQVPCSIPILPGISLYSAMRELLSGNGGDAYSFFLSALSVGGGIACGIAFISVIINISTEIQKRFRDIITKKSS